MITRKELHEIEMDLVNLCEDNEVMRETILNYFTDLMDKCTNETEKVIK